MNCLYIYYRFIVLCFFFLKTKGKQDIGQNGKMTYVFTKLYDKSKGETKRPTKKKKRAKIATLDQISMIAIFFLVNYNLLSAKN